MRVLAVDQGTSSTKAMVVEEDGSVLSVAEVPIFVNARADGAVEISPQELLDSVVEAGRRAVVASGASIDAVGLANQGETILAWDRSTGEPLSHCIVWQDRRSLGVCDSLAAAGFAERLACLTGLELDPYFVAPKIAWLRPQVGNAAMITTTDTWLLHQLTGAFVTDVSTASRSLLLDLEAVSWSEEACSMFGIDRRDLPKIVSNTTVVGETSAFSSADSSSPSSPSSGRSVPISGTCVDQQAALFAESCFASGEAKCTYGTGAFLLASTGPQPKRSSNGLVSCVAWTVDGATTWCLDGQVYTAGSAVTWLQQIGVLDAAADIDGLVAQASPAGETFVPGLAGLAAPFWQASAKGAFTGLSLATGRGELVAAVVEGLTASVAWVVRAAGADLGAPLTRLRVDGGLTRSHTLLQMQADLAQLPIEVYPSPHATALGVAAFARLGADGGGGGGGGGGAGGGGSGSTWEPSAVFEPGISADEAEARLRRWRSAAEATMSL